MEGKPGTRCPSCGTDAAPQAKFCAECGAALARAGASPPGGEGERRQVTVMFCDLVGSTPLAERLDPEELRDVVRAYQDVCAGAITGFEGHVAKYLGDGVLAYFGYPLAHEDDPHRGIRAGLAILGEMKRLDAELAVSRGIRLAMRIGIHTGLVVAGEMGTGVTRERMAVVGDTPNIAARLQEIAEPGTVVVSAATHRLTRGFFECRALGPRRLKGLSTPVEVYTVLGETGARSRLEVALDLGLTPLVGRQQELAVLVERWGQARDGAGQVVLVSGEPGIGKSRLLQALKEQLVGEPHLRLECRCSPYHEHSALYPVIDLLQRAWQFTSTDTPEEKLAKMERALELYPPGVPDAAALLASLLSLPLPAAAALGSSPQRQKQKTLEVLVALLLVMAGHEPLVFAVEDLHWVDPSSQELLGLLIEQVPAARILVLLIYRPSFQPPWALPAGVTRLALSRLAPEQAMKMVELVAGGKTLPAEVLRQLGDRTDGVPLYVEELTKMVLESGMLHERDDRYEVSGPLPAVAIPATLQDSLMARLDRLAPVKEVAQLGATLGRSFSYELLRYVSLLDEPTLQQELRRLVDAEVLHQRGTPPDATYVFKHALIQEAAYNSLLRSRRQQYHERIANVFLERFPDTGHTQPELLVHHFAAAGLSEQAVVYCLRAGERAVERSAHVEAVSHLGRGLELLAALPETIERDQRELALQIALGAALVPTRGYAAPEVERVYARARELCGRAGRPEELFRVLWGLIVFYEVRAELPIARDLATERLRLAERAPELPLVQAHDSLGSVLFWRGEFEPALVHLERGIALYDPRQHRHLAVLYGQDSGVVCRVYAALALWFLGHADRALAVSREALALARELSHPYSLACCMDFAAALHQVRGEPERTQELARPAIALATDQGFPFWVGMGTILDGWALAMQGQGEEGAAQMMQGMASYQGTGAELGGPYCLALLAEAYRATGRLDEALGMLGMALAAADKSEERFWEAEILRLKGALLLAQSPDNEPEAEACLRQAIDVARRQRARPLELRAVTSLGRLWARHGRRAEARRLVADVYGWFTEGFESADLKRAAALLSELS